MPTLIDKIQAKQARLAVIGLGYVGLPLAIAFSKHLNVLGYDISKRKIDELQSGIDTTNEVGDLVLIKTSAEFTNDAKELERCIFIVVAVPTPINDDKSPNLYPIKSASEIVGKHLKKT